MVKTTITISGMHCASCVKLVSTTLNKIPGVTETSVNLATNKAYVTSTKNLNLTLIKNQIKTIGYEVIDNFYSATDIIHNELVESKKKLIISWALVVPIILLITGEMIFGLMPSIITKLIAIVLSAIIIFLPGWKTISTGLSNLFHGNASMDSLISIGTLTALLTGPLSIFFPTIADFSMGSALIMTFHLTGRFIENRAKGQTSESIRNLLEMAATTATIIKNNKFIKIPIDSLQIGDVMYVKPGEKIPTDGIIIDGTTSIDQSLVTGESMPVIKKLNDLVIGATINYDGLIKVKVTKIGDKTFLSQIIKLIENAQSTQVPIQALVDKITGIFVPIILVLSALTFLFWFLLPNQIAILRNLINSIFHFSNLSASSTLSSSLYAAIAVLVIACPCALGLATPTALVVATGIGARLGILIKNGAVLQKMKDVKSIIFDKTGTLTQGKPVVDKVTSVVPDFSKNLIQYAASVESGSSHPIAQAIVNFAKQKNIKILPIKNFKNYPGFGISATIKNQIVKIGTLKFLNLPNLFHLAINTTVHISISGKYLGNISLSDKIKPESTQVINKLKQMGYEIYLLTGDNQQAANIISKQTGIEKNNVFAEILPEDKINIVKKLQQNSKTNQKVAFVGDGINDAPALTQADVGIAMGNGTDIAIESGDIVLTQGKLQSVISAISLSKKTFTKIKTNLFWAFFYNIIMIPLAMLGLLHPVLAEIAMAFSSITVVVNANLLKKERI